MAGKKLENPRRKDDATLADSAFSLDSPLSEGHMGALPPTPEKILDMLRGILSEARVLANDSGMATCMNEDGTYRVYSNLPRNLRGSWMVKTKDGQFLVGRTRSVWALVYDRPPESFYEIPEFMKANIDLKKRDILSIRGKIRYLSRVSRLEVEKLNCLAIVPPGATTRKEDTLAPSADGTFSYTDIKRKLAAATDVSSDDLLFGIGEFASGIKFITTLEDAQGKKHYYIVTGETEQSYWLYINSNAAPPDGCLSTTTFRYKGDRCVLYRES